MTDFHESQAKYWFDESCRKAFLIGGITACIEATETTNPVTKVTPKNAIDNIRRLLADFDAETARLRGGTR